jgi:ribosomal protein L37AE/L43A
MTICEHCGSPTASRKYDDVFMCDDCLFTKLGIHIYHPIYVCANCNKKFSESHYPHYINEYNAHFCSKDCALDYYSDEE